MGLRSQKYGKSLYSKHTPRAAAPSCPLRLSPLLGPTRPSPSGRSREEAELYPLPRPAPVGPKGAKADSLPSSSSDGWGGEPLQTPSRAAARHALRKVILLLGKSNISSRQFLYNFPRKVILLFSKYDITFPSAPHPSARRGTALGSAPLSRDGSPRGKRRAAAQA